jgi:hypothetical protein
VHHDPDSYPRAVDAFEVAKAAQERGLRGIVLKNHWTETGGLAYLVRKYATPGFEVFGAVTLDTAVGGLNPQAVRTSPTSRAGSAGSSGCRRTTRSTRSATTRRAARSCACRANGALVPEANQVIAVVAEHDFTLATGHVDGDEALLILRAAKAAGVKRLIVTHPLFLPQYTYMSLDQLRASIDLGAYIEIVGRSLTKDGESKEKTLAAMRALGAQHFFVSSDAGLVRRAQSNGHARNRRKDAARGRRIRGGPHAHVQGQSSLSREAAGARRRATRALSPSRRAGPSPSPRRNSWWLSVWLLSLSADAKSRPGTASASFCVMTPSLLVSAASKLS